MMEKRNFSRMPFQNHVEIYPVFPSYSDPEDLGETPMTGQSLDISGGGLGLKTSKPLKPGSFLKLRFQMGLEVVEAFGKIVWAREACCGMSFYPMSSFLKGEIQDYMAGLQPG